MTAHGRRVEAAFDDALRLAIEFEHSNGIGAAIGKAKQHARRLPGAGDGAAPEPFPVLFGAEGVEIEDRFPGRIGQRGKIGRQPIPATEWMIGAAMKIEQPVAAPGRGNQPILAFDHFLDRDAIRLEFRRRQQPFGFRIHFGDELRGLRIVVAFKVEVHGCSGFYC